MQRFGAAVLNGDLLDTVPFNRNRIMQALIAILAGWGIPFVCTETQDLGEEIIGSYLYQVHLYHWLQSNGYGRCLADGDL